MSHDDRLTRRGFLHAALTSAALTPSLAGCGAPAPGSSKTPAPKADSPPAKAIRPETVSLVPCKSYEQGEVAEALAEALRLAPPPKVTGKTVLVKPNFVEYSPHRPIHTDVTLIGEIVRAFLARGAKRVVVGEGPGHRRDTWEVFTQSGLIGVCRGLGVSLVDLNYDSLRWHPVEDKTGSHMAQLMMPRTVLEADLIVSAAKLKTHHWVGTTLCLKNLFGLVPGVKYGWPKNILHFHPQGINASIAALAGAFPPAYSVVDGIVAMEGDGPLRGEPVALGLIVAGRDPVAVDTTCATLIGLDPRKIDYLRRCIAAGLGKGDPEKRVLAGATESRFRRSFRILPHLNPLR